MSQPFEGPGVAFRAAASFAQVVPGVVAVPATAGIAMDANATTVVAAAVDHVSPVAAVAVAGDAGTATSEIPIARAIAFSPTLLAQLVATQAVPDVEHLPLAGTVSGSIFQDRADPALRWYLPAFTAVDPDSGFAFDAVQADKANQGGDKPFDRATLSFAILAGDPPDLAAARAAEPDATFQAIPFADLQATLNLPYSDDTGQDQVTSISAVVTAQGDGTYTVVINGLVGSSVLLCWADLRVVSQASLAVTGTYRVCRRVTKGPPSWLLLEAVPHLVAPPAVGLPASAAYASPLLAKASPGEFEGEPHAGPFVRIRRPPDGADGHAGGDQGAGEESYIDGLASSTTQIALAPVYGSGSYFPSYRLTANGKTRAIIDVHDLDEFQSRRSEYVELVSLSAHQAERYPSIRRLYIGQVTGNVVAVPATYGIMRGAGGCAALVSAIVDERTESLTGCQFQLTFGLAPAVDPIELARLADDLLTTPEAAAHGRLNLMLPSGLDPRVAGSLAGSLATSTSFADGSDPSTVLLSASIQDGDVPAINKVNAFLSALAVSSGMSLFGEIGVRLDDVYEPPVTSTVLLNLHETSDGDDLLLEAASGLTAVDATNAAPFSLHLRALAEHVQGVLAESALDVVLGPGAMQSLALTQAADAGTALLVRREIALPDGSPRAAVADCVTFQAQTVQQTRYRLGLNGTGLSLDAIGVVDVAFAIALVDLPTVQVDPDPIVLTPTHLIDWAFVTIPIQVVVSGLPSELSVTLKLANGGTKQVQLHHDFWEEPIMVVENADLA